jgi:hypothetical protein
VSAGSSGANNIVDDNHPDTQSKKVHLNPIFCKLFGASLIIISYLILTRLKHFEKSTQ